MREDARANDELPEDRERRRVVVRDEVARSTLRTIATFAAALGDRLPLPDILEAALDAVQEALAVRRSSVLLRDAGGNMRVRASRGVSAQLREAVEAFTPWRGETTGSRLATGDAHVNPDLAALSAVEGAEDVRRVLLLPLFVEGRLFGRLDAYLDHQRAFSADERSAAEAIAHVLALAVARNREHRGRRLLGRASEMLGASLDVEATLGAVARLAIEDLADACSIHLLRNEQLERVVVVDRDPAQTEAMRRMGDRFPLRANASFGPARAIATGQPEIYSGVAEEMLSASATSDEHAALLRELQLRSGMCVPLIARGKTVGTITLLARAREHAFDDVDLEVVVELARHAALAVDNARLYRAELDARRVAERAAWRTERIRELTETLAAARSRGQVAEAVLAHALPALGATGGTLGMRTVDGQELELVAAVGYASDVVDRTRRFSLDADLPLARAMRTGEALFGTAEGDAATIDDGVRTGNAEAWIAVPLALEGATIGALGLTLPHERRLDEDDWAYLHVLARQTAQALERARLHDAEQRSRAEAAAAQRRLLFLAEANALFASSLEFELRLQRLAQVAVESVADYCLIYLGDETGLLHHASAHVDRSRAPLVQRVAEAFRPDPDNPHGLLERVLHTGRSIRVRELPADFAMRAGPDPQTQEAVRRLGAYSAMVVPLVARGQVIGGAAFISARPDCLYESADLAFAEELVRRAAVAVDNALLYRAALDANQSKANFLAVMSHELRTPLTAILGYSELLADEIMGPLNGVQRDQLLRIHASGLHLLSLIEEILSYSRIEAGQESVTLEPIELSRLVDATDVIIDPLAARKKLRYHVQVPDAPIVIVTDAAKVRQILLNLLANAVKFTDSGTISLSASLEGDDAVFRVRDTGIGISPDHLEQIFEPFWQVEQTMTRRVGGTGLGLSIARQLAAMLGGEVSVTSTVGEGSIFTVRLPTVPSDAPGHA